MAGKKKKVSVIGVMTDRNGRERKKVSVIGVMTDRNGRGKGENVRHRYDDGQKWAGKRKKCPS